MASKCERKSRGKKPGKRTKGELREFSIFEAVREIASHNARNTDTEEGLIEWLKSWWSKEYGRPLKDPILESYTVHELLYEYYNKIERIEAAEEVFELNADKIEEAQEENTLDWVEEEERKDHEAAEKAEAENSAKDEKWMLEQMKKEHGEDFGKDIDSDFD